MRSGLDMRGDRDDETERIPPKIEPTLRWQTTHPNRHAVRNAVPGLARITNPHEKREQSARHGCKKRRYICGGSRASLLAGARSGRLVT